MHGGAVLEMLNKTNSGKSKSRPGPKLKLPELTTSQLLACSALKEKYRQTKLLQETAQKAKHTTPEFEKKHKKKPQTQAEKDFQDFHADMQKDYLVRIANQLDQKGLYEEANRMDQIIKRYHHA